MSQNYAEPSAHDQVLDALSLFMSDLQRAAYAAIGFVREGDTVGTAAAEVDAARLQGLGDNLITVQSWLLEYPEPFSTPKVDEGQLLARLNLLHSQAKQMLKEPERSTLAKYFERSASIIDLLFSHPNVNNVRFLLGTLQLALDDEPHNLPEAEVKPTNETAPVKHPESTGINIFVAAGDASLTAAEELALKLNTRKAGSAQIKVHQSWTWLPNLSELPLGGVTSVIRRCQYGALVLAAEETTTKETTAEDTTADPDDTDPARSDSVHLRLSPDVEFLLGLTVGAFGIEKTFLVVPSTEKDKPKLAAFLNGLKSASYDPEDIDSETAMDMAATMIVRTIVAQEKRRVKQGG